jgi:hypothetical protein
MKQIDTRKDEFGTTSRKGSKSIVQSSMKKYFQGFQKRGHMRYVYALFEPGCPCSSAHVVFSRLLALPMTGRFFG